LFDASWAFETPTNYYIPKEPFDETLKNAVITDVFLRPTIKGGTFPIGCNERAGQKTGMPVLYYKADTSKLNHDSNDLFTFPSNPNIYNFDDNYALTLLGCPWEASPPPPGGTGASHPMADDPGLFIKEITNTQVTATPRPHREDGYILMSAGFDGLYGTRDDVFNFSE
jgi:hypothetical protein